MKNPEVGFKFKFTFDGTGPFYFLIAFLSTQLHYILVRHWNAQAFFFSSLSNIWIRKYSVLILPFCRVQLPYSQAGITIERSSIYVKVVSKADIVFMWNQHDSILVRTTLGPACTFRSAKKLIFD